MADSGANNGGEQDDDLPPGDLPRQERSLRKETPQQQAFQQRLDRLEARIREARGPEEDQSSGPEGRGSAMGAAFKLATEMVAGVAVGGGLGYFGDRAAGTSPFLLIVFLMLGGAAGIMNAVRVAREMQKQVGRRDPNSGRPGQQP